MSEDNTTDTPLYAWKPLVSAFQDQQQLSDVSGLNPEMIIVSRYCSMPLPIYPVSWPEKRKRWEGTKPNIMWHPVMWLPDELSGRFVDENGEAESDDLWALRVALEMEFRGLYNSKTGWIDLLALYGENIDDPSVQQRLEAWMDGGSDPVFDNIVLPPPQVNEEIAAIPNWSLVMAMNMMPKLTRVYALSDAQDLQQALDEVIVDVIEGAVDNVDEAVNALLNIATFLSVSFIGIPGCGEEWWDDYAAWTYDFFAGVTTVDSNNNQIITKSDLTNYASDPMVREALERLSDIETEYADAYERFVQ